MCLALYLAGMVVALVLCGVLLLFPSTRRFAIRFAAAVVGSLPGVLLFQFVVAIPLGVLLAVVLGSYSLFHASDTAQWIVGIPTIIIMFVSILAASLLGCYTGGHIAWRLAAFTPWRVVVAEEPVFRFMSTLFRRRRPNHAMERTADRS
jgi:hypothetical protein